MIPTDMPFEFKRIQFPIRVAFAMTINKSQGQSLSVRGLNLDTQVFLMVSYMWHVHVLVNHRLYLFLRLILNEFNFQFVLHLR
jgi:PIF1 helicase.